MRFVCLIFAAVCPCLFQFLSEGSGVDGLSDVYEAFVVDVDEEAVGGDVFVCMFVADEYQCELASVGLGIGEWLRVGRHGFRQQWYA